MICKLRLYRPEEKEKLSVENFIQVETVYFLEENEVVLFSLDHEYDQQGA